MIFIVLPVYIVTLISVYYALNIPHPASPLDYSLSGLTDLPVYLSYFMYDPSNSELSVCYGITGLIGLLLYRFYSNEFVSSVYSTEPDTLDLVVACIAGMIVLVPLTILVYWAGSVFLDQYPSVNLMSPIPVFAMIFSMQLYSMAYDYPSASKATVMIFIFVWGALGIEATFVHMDDGILSDAYIPSLVAILYSILVVSFLNAKHT